MGTQSIIPQRTEIEPVRIEAYKCPVEGCGRILKGTYEEAKTHVNQPVGIGLPRGLVFFTTADYYNVIASEVLFRINSEEIDAKYSHLAEDHSYECGACVFSRCSPNEFFSTNIISSGSFKQSVLRGESYFLNEIQFQEFNSAFSRYLTERNIVPVRTTPELEKMLTEDKK